MSSPRLLTLRVELAGAEPEVSRRLRLGDSLTLEHVHLAPRAAMGWEEGGASGPRAGAPCTRPGPASAGSSACAARVGTSS